MFSSSMYTTLMSTASAVDGYRTLSFDRNAGLITILFGFFRRFAVQFPNQIWAQQTVLCEVTLLLLCFILLKTEKAKRKAAWIVINVGFAAYFLYYHFYGQIQLPSEWWSNVLSAGISILYFCAVICQVFSLFGVEPPKNPTKIVDNLKHRKSPKDLSMMYKAVSDLYQNI